LTNHSASAGLRTRTIQAWLFIQRHETKYTKILARYLMRRNERCKTPVIASGGPVVSMTTYGERLKSVHLALEGIAAGSVLPSRMVLWVDVPQALNNPTPGLKRLVGRGLEIRLSDNYGPHTKYYPYVQSAGELEIPLVTGDDDLLYSKWWLAGLVDANREFPDAVNCYRAHSIKIANGAIAPYQQWNRCFSTKPSFAHFATGVSGCIYPPQLLRRLKQTGTEFMSLCPKADDVWLHVQALRTRTKIRQVRNRPLRFPFVPGTQESGLYHENVLLSRNDAQIKNTYTDADIAILES
jgi:hypothetical protein